MPEDKYEYGLDERSLTQHWLTGHVWVPLAKRLPRGLAPNAITVFGAVSMAASLPCVYLAIEGSRWGSLGTLVCTLLYLTADNVDGPHARNTDQCSRLGEFLDHWLDAINGGILSLSVALCLGISGPLLLAFVIAVTMAYFATIWEQHHTGTLHSEVLGSNEGILLTCGVYLLLFVLPDATWLRYSPGAPSLALFLGLFSIGGSLFTVAKVLSRFRKRLVQFIPVLLSCAALVSGAVSGIVDERVAAGGVLAMNALFSGALLVAHIGGRHSRYRARVVSTLSVISLVLVIVWPEGFGPFAGSVPVLLVLAIVTGVTIAKDLYHAAATL
jgi:phosphatidylglycerophosphate synthase